MRRAFLAFSMAALAVMAWPTASASAQSSKATGTVASIDGASVTVKVGAQDMKFSVDAKTVVQARGAGTKDRAAEAKGAAGAKLTDVIKAGMAVEVTYTGMGASMHATEIREVSSVGSGGGGMAASAPPSMTSSGTVTAVAGDSVTITAAGGAQTFAIGADTKVIGTGAGTAAAAKGGKIAVTDLIGKGDRVTVSYHTMGMTMHAAEIRVTAKSKG